MLRREFIGLLGATAAWPPFLDGSAFLTTWTRKPLELHAANTIAAVTAARTEQMIPPIKLTRYGSIAIMTKWRMVPAI